MSQELIDPEILADFIIEAKEHLETIEPTLLLLEKEPDNNVLLNDIFRPMHSLKGASGFMGLNRMNGLAHRAENILDELRKGTMHVTTEIMDVILAATDVLRHIIDNIETTNSEGDVDTSHLIVIIDALMAGETPPPLEAGGSSQRANAAEVAGRAGGDKNPGSTGEAQGPGSAKGDGSAGDASDQRQSADVELWLEGRPAVPPYALVAFGEGHLRDFMEEAKENVSNLSEQLLDLENNPDNESVVHDLFRMFHNLKGNSGIVGYLEINSLTHEAETLLNNVRKRESSVTAPLIDLLLFTVDVLEALILRIDPTTSKAAPFDTSELVGQLQQAVAGGAISLPKSSLTQQAAPQAPKAEAAPGFTGDTSSDEDISAFEDTVCQQVANIAKSMDGLRKDGTSREFIDPLYRSLVSLKNACGFMGLEEIKIYAQRTADIVGKGRETGMDFTLMVDLLEQECAILRDMIKDAIERMRNPSLAAAQTVLKVAPQPVAPAPAPKPEAPKPAPVAPPKPAPVAAPKPAADPAPKAPSLRDEVLREDSPKPVAAAQPAPVGKPAPKPAPKEEQQPKASSTIRVDHEKLDHLMNVIGELIINRNRFSMLARQLEETSSLEQVPPIAQNLSETTYAMARISDDLQATIMKVRMVPVASVFSRFSRLVRDLARKSMKEVELVVEGEDTELDKSVVEVIGDPLVHLIRNSVDHGIEFDDVRMAAGKPAKGTVHLRAFYKGNSVTIEIEDDGKGIDPEKMRQVAIKKGLITPEDAKQLDDREAMELIFAPGFSSAEEITDISGRGVGMDVVRTNIKSLKGSINIQSEIGKGTRFSLSLPLTLAIIDALMVNVAGNMFAIPLDAVSETTKIESHRLTDMKGRKAVTLRGEVLGIVSLAEILDLPCSMKEQDILSVVIIHDNERRLGIVVDTLHERQEVVIKPLGEYLGDIQGISGATIMGDGSVILILDPHEMYSLATKTG